MAEAVPEGNAAVPIAVPDPLTTMPIAATVEKHEEQEYEMATYPVVQQEGWLIF